MPPRRSIPRVVHAVVWTVGIGFLFFLARVSQVARERSDPGASQGPGYAAGVVFGSVVAALLVAVVVRWAYLRARRRSGTVRSVWLLGIASAVLMLNVVATTGRPAAPVDPGAATSRVADRLRIALPYSLGPAGEAAERALLDPIVAQGARAGLRAADIKAILDGSDTVGYLVVIDVNIQGGDVEDYVTGFMEGASRQGGSARRDEIAGQDLAIVSGPDATLVGWAEAPLVVTLVGFDETSAIEMTKATLASVP